MRPIHNPKHQRGFSLVEVMVATAILVVVLAGILILYDRANQVFKAGNEAAEMQQNLRIAYERLVGDVRMAGFDYMRGGPLLPGQSAAPWATTRGYTAGTIVTPTPGNANGFTYRAINPGTSGSTEPSWPTGAGATVVENGATPPITWQQNGGAVYQQPDEQIEYAGATALTVRANFDYSANPTADDHGTEPGLVPAQGQFPLVTTGNDEIVTYGLVSDRAPSGTAPNTQSISFFADVHVPRAAFPGGSAENQVTIDGVDLTNANPPYTLYRFTLDNTGAVVRTPLANNIRSLNFFYFEDQSGQKALTDAAGAFAPNVGGGGQFDPAVANSGNAPERLVRRKIRAVRVRLVGMNAQQDVNYSDTSTANGQFSSTDSTGNPVFATDTVAPTYRRLTVDTLIAPRNLGMTGMAQNFLKPPPRPTITSVCIGYCGIAVVSWDPNTNNPNASYAVLWDTNANGSFSNAFDAGTSNTFAVDLTQQDLSQTFYFRVRAYNAGGSVFSTTPDISAVAANATVPNPPTSITASGGGSIPPLSNKVHLTWSAPVTNASGGPSCVPSGTPSVSSYLREIKGFRIYRGVGASFTPSGTTAGTGNCILDENTAGPTAPQGDGYGNFRWDDTTAGCGVAYHYKLETVEWCVASDTYNNPAGAANAVSAPSAGTPGQVGTSSQPARPLGMEVAPLAPTPPPIGMANSVCNGGVGPQGNCSVELRFQKVTTDISIPPNTLAIDAYNLRRVQKLNNVVISTVITPITGQLATSGNYVTFTDLNVPMFDAATHVDYVYEYTAQAVQSGGSCPNGQYSTPPAIFPPPCSFSGSVFVVTGASQGDGLTPASAWILDQGDTIRVNPPAGTTFIVTRMDIVDPSGVTISSSLSFASPALFTWIDLTPSTPYTVTFTMTDNAFPPCTEQIVRYITQQGPPTCMLVTLNTNSSILANTAIDYQVKLDLRNMSPEALTIQAIDIDWTPPSFRQWGSIQFPSGATLPGPLVIGGAFTFTLFPRPGLVTVADVTIPAGGTRSILLNFAQSVPGHPNPTIFPTTAINSVCVHYKAPSVNAFTFFCRVVPQPGAQNPNFCP
jgi:prepilin-type N-terminal cleavage/methylation domain-containing protein